MERKEDSQTPAAAFNIIASADKGQVRFNAEFSALAQDTSTVVYDVEGRIDGVVCTPNLTQLERVVTAYRETSGGVCSRTFAAFAASLSGQGTDFERLSRESKDLRSAMDNKDMRPFEDFAIRVRQILSSPEARVLAYGHLEIKPPAPK